MGKQKKIEKRMKKRGWGQKPPYQTHNSFLWMDYCGMFGFQHQTMLVYNNGHLRQTSTTSQICENKTGKNCFSFCLNTLFATFVLMLAPRHGDLRTYFESHQPITQMDN